MTKIKLPKSAFCKRCDKDMAPKENGRCSGCGGFLKGIGGNLKGRPKKIKEETIDDCEIPEEHREWYRDDPMAALLYLMNTAKTRKELGQYANKAIPFKEAKKQSVQQEVKQATTLTIQWAGDLDSKVTSKVSPQDDTSFRVIEDKSEDIIDVTPEASAPKAKNRTTRKAKNKSKD